MTDTLLQRVRDAIGQQYEVESEIGRGGMAVVYKARDVRLNRTVAVKVLPPELAYDPAIRMRFTREAQTAAQLSHAHIVPIYDVGEREGIAYFVMALVTGGHLGTLLAREPRLPVDEVRRLICEIADALAYAHLRGVIHRDVKPDNILLDGESGRAVVTDFGIARAVEAGTRLTITGNAVGTPTYMSPEQAMGEREIDGRSDIYSLGVLGYQMLTGRVPFTAGNSMALLLKHVGEPPRPIAELRPDAPKVLREAVERALLKAPEDRWPSAAALRDAIGTDRAAAAAWRPDQREPVRYTSPRPESARPDAGRGESARDGARAIAAPRRETEARAALPAPSPAPAGALVMEPPHLAGLTPEQRADLRIWHGHVNLLDRIRAWRRHAFLTFVTTVAGTVAFVAGINEMPPLALAPIVPFFMWRTLLRRNRSLRASGLRLRQVLFALRSRRVLPKPPTAPPLGKIAPREILEGPHGAAIRRAADDRAAILDLVAKLSKADRAQLPEVVPTANALVERVAQLAQSIERLDASMDPRLAGELDARIREVEHDSDAPEGQRRLTLLRRQRATIEELVQRRAALARQLDNAGLALGNLRLDLIKLRSSGLQSAFSDVSSATQEARALSRDIDVVLAAAAEVKSL